MKIVSLNGQIEILTGLHIGGGDDTMKIGGIDNQVVKDVNSGKPYIPGSSLKGKMRSLLEWNNKLVGYGDGKPFGSDKLEKILNPQDKKNAEILIKLFGDSYQKNDKEKNDKEKYGITRISVSDCSLIEVDGQKTSEAKYENVINRETGKAEHPRQIERIPSGVKFNFNIRVKVVEEDNESELKKMVEDGLNLIENDYLGGNGSRGYGRVKFTDRKWS